MTAAGANTQSGKAPGVVTLRQISASEFEFAYDLNASPSSFVFISASSGNFDDSGIFHGDALNLTQELTLGARGSEGSEVRIEITDTNHKRADFTLPLRPVYQNYTLDLSDSNVPAGFDRGHVAQIVFSEDRNTHPSILKDLVGIRLQPLVFNPPITPVNLENMRQSLITDGASYFESGTGMDPLTHLPFDNVEIDGRVQSDAKFTQPTLIGFFFQILGDIVNGKIHNGFTPGQALNELSDSFSTLEKVQSDENISWKGLLPWLSLPSLGFGPTQENIGLGDNANLAQSLAVLAGALESANLNDADRQKADALIARIDAFLGKQAAGYEAFVDRTNGLFHASYNMKTGEFSGHIDRLANEFRGAIAFLKVRFSEQVPSSTWTGLLPVFSNYTASNGSTIKNLAYYDGGAFQAFWPSLKNNEMAFAGFRSALANALATFSDYSKQNRIPGFLSASQRPNNNDPGGEYYPRIGIPEIAESGTSHQSEYLIDTGSTYGLASAYSIDPLAVLNWLQSIEAQLPNARGDFGFYDSARSNSEVARRYLGIDVAATVLGLAGAGPADFEAYLTKRGLLLDYNLLYDQASKKLLSISKTPLVTAAPPEFPDRNYSVFNHFLNPAGTINEFPADAADFTHASFKYTTLKEGFGGRFWELNQPYDAQSNQLLIYYSVIDPPDRPVKIDLKDENGKLVYSTTALLNNSREIQKLTLDLPNQTALSHVKTVIFVVEQGTGADRGAEFTLHGIDFQHLRSAQEIRPSSALGPGNVTSLPDSPSVQVIANTSDNSLLRLSSKDGRLTYRLSQPDSFSSVFINFDPQGSQASGNILSLSKLVFGIKSGTVKSLKLEIEDKDGKTAVFYLKDIGPQANYYQILTSRLAKDLDLTRVKRISFVVDQSSIGPGGETGSFDFELGGLSF